MTHSSNLALLPIFMLVLFIAACKPSKITDPHHPDFKSEEFAWDDYGSAHELVKVFRAIFPKGTSKDNIEKILLGQPEAKILDEYDLVEYKKKINPIISSRIIDKELNDDPDFVRTTHFSKYNYPMKQNHFAPTTGWMTTVFYDENNQMTNMVVYTEVVHLNDKDN